MPYVHCSLIAIWGGFGELNPPLPEPSPFNPEAAAAVRQPRHGHGGDALLRHRRWPSSAAALHRPAHPQTRPDGSRHWPQRRATPQRSSPCGVYLVWEGRHSHQPRRQLVLPARRPRSPGHRLLHRHAQPSPAPLVYAGILVVTVIWSVAESGLDFIALLPRLAAWTVFGLWFITPLVAKVRHAPGAGSHRAQGRPRAAGFRRPRQRASCSPSPACGPLQPSKAPRTRLPRTPPSPTGATMAACSKA